MVNKSHYDTYHAVHMRLLVFTNFHLEIMLLFTTQVSPHTHKHTHTCTMTVACNLNENTYRHDHEYTRTHMDTQTHLYKALHTHSIFFLNIVDADSVHTCTYKCSTRGHIALAKPSSAARRTSHTHTHTDTLPHLYTHTKHYEIIPGCGNQVL
jgi:hypothetical protein